MIGYRNYYVDIPVVAVVQWGDFVNKSQNFSLILTQYKPTTIIIISIIARVPNFIILIISPLICMQKCPKGWIWDRGVILTTH